MRLSDIMGRLDLALFPQIALVIFGIAFIAILVRAFSRARAAEFEHAASLPLQSQVEQPTDNGNTP